MADNTKQNQMGTSAIFFNNNKKKLSLDHPGRIDIENICLQKGCSPFLFSIATFINMATLRDYC